MKAVGCLGGLLAVGSISSFLRTGEASALVGLVVAVVIAGLWWLSSQMGRTQV